MNSKFIREIIESFAKVGHVEYRFTNNQVAIFKDKKIIAMIKDDNLYIVDGESKLVQVT